MTCRRWRKEKFLSKLFLPDIADRSYSLFCNILRSHWSSQVKTSKSWPQLALISMSWMYAVLKRHSVAKWKMANKHLIDCRGDAPQLILQLSLCRQIIFIWSLSHLIMYSSFLYHTKIYVFHYFFFGSQTLCLILSSRKGVASQNMPFESYQEEYQQY